MRQPIQLATSSADAGPKARRWRRITVSSASSGAFRSGAASERHRRLGRPLPVLRHARQRAPAHERAPFVARAGARAPRRRSRPGARRPSRRRRRRSPRRCAASAAKASSALRSSSEDVAFVRRQSVSPELLDDRVVGRVLARRDEVQRRAQVDPDDELARRQRVVQLRGLEVLHPRPQRERRRCPRLRLQRPDRLDDLDHRGVERLEQPLPREQRPVQRPISFRACHRRNRICHTSTQSSTVTVPVATRTGRSRSTPACSASRTARTSRTRAGSGGCEVVAPGAPHLAHAGQERRGRHRDARDLLTTDIEGDRDEFAAAGVEVERDHRPRRHRTGAARRWPATRDVLPARPGRQLVPDRRRDVAWSHVASDRRRRAEPRPRHRPSFRARRILRRARVAQPGEARRPRRAVGADGITAAAAAADIRDSDALAAAKMLDAGHGTILFTTGGAAIGRTRCAPGSETRSRARSPTRGCCTRRSRRAAVRTRRRPSPAERLAKTTSRRTSRRSWWSHHANRGGFQTVVD